MFSLLKFPPSTQKFFDDPLIPWLSLFQSAIDEGVSNVDDLTDLLFFKTHNERMIGRKGKPLDPSEPEFDELVKEWEGWRRTVVKLMKPSNKSNDSRWEVSPDVLRDIRDMGGEIAAEWVSKAPTEKRMAQEFQPAASHRNDYEALIIWKSREPSQTCPQSNKMVQTAFLLRTDIEYWRARTDSEITAQVKQAEANGFLLDFRQFVVQEKLCIPAARIKSKALGDIMMLNMVKELLTIIPVPALQGSKIVKNLGELISAVASASK